MSAEPRRVLVVDDDDLVRGVVTRIAAEVFAEPVAAASGSEALAALRDGAFDLVITDLRMPGVDGLEIVRWLRAERPATPIVVITGFASVGDEEEIGTLGVELLRKPFGAAGLREAIARALAARA